MPQNAPIMQRCCRMGCSDGSEMRSREADVLRLAWRALFVVASWYVLLRVLGWWDEVVWAPMHLDQVMQWMFLAEIGSLGTMTFLFGAALVAAGVVTLVMLRVAMWLEFAVAGPTDELPRKLDR